MRCIICDRCGKIVEDPRQMRVVTCARPIGAPMCGSGAQVVYRGDDRQRNDILWQADVCGECLAALEDFMENNSPAPGPGGDGPTDPEAPPQEGGDEPAGA